MKTIRNISIVLFLGLSIVVGLNLELFIEKTSNFIYVVSGEEERDLEKQREKEKKKIEKEREKKKKEKKEAWDGLTSEIENGLENITKYEEDILNGMDLLINQKKLNELFPLKVSSTNNDGAVYDNICVKGSYTWTSKIIVENNSSVPVKTINIRFKAYNDDKNLTYENKTDSTRFEYFLEPGDSEVASCWDFNLKPSEYEELKMKKAIFKYEVISTSEHKIGAMPTLSKQPCKSYERLFYLNKEILSIEWKLMYIKENYPELHERIPTGGFDIKQNLLDFCSKY